MEYQFVDPANKFYLGFFTCQLNF